jgi:hypothetical protein
MAGQKAKSIKKIQKKIDKIEERQEKTRKTPKAFKFQKPSKNATYTKGGPPIENDNARRWSDQQLVTLADAIVFYAEESYSVVSITDKLGMDDTYIYKLSSRYKVVCQALTRAKNIIAGRAWEHAFLGIGMQSVVQETIRVHDRKFSDESAKINRNQKKKIDKDSEKIKTDEKLRYTKEFAKSLENNGSFTPAQLLKIADLVNAEVKRSEET